MSRASIIGVRGREIFDSRGRPTVEVDVTLVNGMIGRAAVPAGASTGAGEAVELRDGDPARFEGRGVLKAVTNVGKTIQPLLIGRDPVDQQGLDDAMRDADGTPGLSRLGANAVLGASMAAARAAALLRHVPLHVHLGELAGVSEPVLPVPMVNILSGGAHAGRGMDVQDFLAVPLADDLRQAVQSIAAVRQAAAELTVRLGASDLLADEGGLSPGLADPREALDLMMSAIEAAGLEPGRDMAIAIDVAASTLSAAPGYYHFAREGRTRTGDEVAAMLAGWAEAYPIVSIEDGLDEEAWDDWRRLTKRLGHIQLVGDDLFATDPARIRRGREQGAANAVLIKPNQNGTVTGTLEAMATARAAGYASIVSARSGETEDSFIADLAVGTAAGQIKIGSWRNSERLSKYNQLLRLRETVKSYAGPAALVPRSTIPPDGQR